jgi:SAM-dependent methyltransferase
VSTSARDDAPVPTSGAGEWDARYAQGSPWSAGPNGTVRQVVEGLPPGRARDVACGDGRHAVWLARLGWQVDAIDFSAVAIERGKARAAAAADELAAQGRTLGTIAWTVGDVATHQPEPASADLVLLSYVHLEPSQAQATLRLAASAVAPGGILLLVGHDRTNLLHGTGGPQRLDVLTHPEAVAGTLRDAGLTVERAEVVERVVDGAERPALDTVVIARRPGRAAGA